MSHHRSSGALLACVALASSALPGWGIQLRSYTPARQDRFTGYPAAPTWNDAAWFGSRAYAGVGWARDDVPYQRQFALVTPLQVVCATHYQPGLGTVIRFLNGNGEIVERTVAALKPVNNELAQPSDLTLVTLSSPLLPADQVPHFPYLNLAAESDYLNAALVVFGWHVKAGRGRLAGFDNVEEPGVNRTRVMRYDYVKSAGNQDDAYVEIGDSGSPTFAVAGGRPALVGIHITVEEDPLRISSYDTFVPHFISQLDAELTATGYQMTPAYPPVVSLTAAPTTTPAVWRQANPGSCRFDVTNTSANAATNVAVVLRFPPAAVPDSLEAPGWIITPAQPGEWWLRRATLAANSSVAITAHWLKLSAGGSLNVEMDLASDGSAQRRLEFQQPLAPSYAAWATGLPDPAPAADPDGDGVVNLLEYAFGGDPAVNSLTGPGGMSLLPEWRVAGGSATLSFPIRDDAARRGLAYVVEFSGTLASESWSAIPPPGAAVVDAANQPPVAGWLRRTVSFPAAAPARFCRVRTELNENP